VPGSLGLILTTPYAKRGLAYQDMTRHHGVDESPVLTWQAPTRRMNPTIPERVVEEALADDEAAARAEWLAEFRADLESFVSIESLREVTVAGRTENPPADDVDYACFIDAAGGSGRDSFTAAVGHISEAERVVLDRLIEIRPPFDPEHAVKTIAATLRAYRVQTVRGDRYAAEWVVSRFRAENLQLDAAEMTRSELYIEALPSIMSRRVELLDHPKLLAQFARLERRHTPSGKDSIDHPRGQHDDLANSVAGLIAHLAAPRFAPTTLEMTGW
jgi:hypothetical protein